METDEVRGGFSSEKYMELMCQNRFCKFSSYGCAKFKICSCFDCVPSISKIKTMLKDGFTKEFEFQFKKIITSLLRN